MATSLFNAGEKVRWISGSCGTLNDDKYRIEYLVVTGIEGMGYRYCAYTLDHQIVDTCFSCLDDSNLERYNGPYQSSTDTVSNHQFKIGDSIRLKSGYHPTEKEREQKITDIEKYQRKVWTRYEGQNSSDPRGSHCDHIDFECMELVSPIKNKKSFMSNLIQKFKVLTASEPKKTFIKAGIMNTEGELSNEGAQLFREFLLEKFGAEFKTEVVDKILAEDEKKNSC